MKRIYQDPKGSEDEPPFNPFHPLTQFSNTTGWRYFTGSSM